MDLTRKDFLKTGAASIVGIPDIEFQAGGVFTDQNYTKIFNWYNSAVSPGAGSVLAFPVVQMSNNVPWYIENISVFMSRNVGGGSVNFNAMDTELTLTDARFWNRAPKSFTGFSVSPGSMLYYLPSVKNSQSWPDRSLILQANQTLQINLRAFGTLTLNDVIEYYLQISWNFYEASTRKKKG